MTDESIVHAEEAEAKDQVEVLTNEEAEAEKAVTTTEMDIVKATNPLQVEMNADFLTAYNTLSTGKVPRDVIMKRQGQGGKVFSYVPHWWVSRQLRIAFGPLWDFEVGEVEVFKDFSASAPVTLTVWIPMGDNEFKETKVTCLGAFQGHAKMATAYIRSSAVSRGLAKAAQLRFGIGEEFYAGEEEGIPDPTPEHAWSALITYGEKKGLTLDEIKAALKDNVAYKELGNQDTFLAAWAILGNAITDKKASEVIGEGTGEPEGF